MPRIVPLSHGLVWERENPEKELKISERKAVVGTKAYRSILRRPQKSMNRKKRMLTAGERNFRESFPLFLCCVVAQFCVNKARGRVLRDSHLIRCLFVVLVLILGIRFSVLSEKLLFLSARQYFNTRDCKFPRYRRCIYFFLYLF